MPVEVKGERAINSQPCRSVHARPGSMSAPSVATACPDCLTSRSTLPQSTAGSRRTAAHTQAVGKTSARPAQLSHTSACTPGSIPSTALIRTAERASPNPATSRRTWPATAKSGPTSARIWTAGKASNYPAPTLAALGMPVTGLEAPAVCTQAPPLEGALACTRQAQQLLGRSSLKGTIF